PHHKHFETCGPVLLQDLAVHPTGAGNADRSSRREEENQSWRADVGVEAVLQLALASEVVDHDRGSRRMGLRDPASDFPEIPELPKEYCAKDHHQDQGTHHYQGNPPHSRRSLLLGIPFSLTSIQGDEQVDAGAVLWPGLGVQSSHPCPRSEE